MGMIAAAVTGKAADMITAILNKFLHKIAEKVIDIVAFLSGNGSEYWTHRVLFGADVIATIVVGAGIILGTPRYSAKVHRIANWMVVLGIAVETLASLLLFMYDEGINHVQQNQLATVQDAANELAIRLSSRAININAFVDDFKTNHKMPIEIFYLSPDVESFKLAYEIKAALNAAKWEVISIEAKSTEELNECFAQTMNSTGYPPIGITVSLRVHGKEALFAYNHEQTLKGAIGKMGEPPVSALIDALAASLIGVPGFIFGVPADPDIVVDAPADGTIRIIIGEKP